MSRDDGDEDRVRTPAEWATLAVSCLVVAALLGLILVRTGDAETPPAPVVTATGPPDEGPGGFAVTVEVTNQGGTTAEAVQVLGELVVGDATYDAEQQIDFLAADQSDEVVIVLPEDPADGELTIRVASFSTP